MENLAEIVIPTPTNPEITGAQAALQSVMSIVVESDEQYSQAADELKSIKAKWKDIDSQRKALKRPISEAGASIQAFFKEPLEYLEKAESVLKIAMVDYSDEQERIRAEAERKEQEKARKREEKLRKQAADAAEKGNDARAETLEDRADNVQVAPVQAAPKVAGVSKVQTWTFEITDPALVPDKYKVIDEKRVRAVVKAMKGDSNIPGIRVYSESSLRSR